MGKRTSLIAKSWRSHTQGNSSRGGHKPTLPQLVDAAQVSKRRRPARAVLIYSASPNRKMLIQGSRSLGSCILGPIYRSFAILGVGSPRCGDG